MSNKSYTQILNSSSIIGSAEFVVQGMSLIRTKFAAILIGTQGVALIAGFTAVQNVMVAIIGLGLQSSAVRNVAGAVENGDALKTGQVILTLKRISLLVGFLGALVMAAISSLISELTFKSNLYALDISLLSVAVFISVISGAQMAVIQGFRRIDDIAKTRILTALLGVIFAVGFYKYLGLRGIVPALLLLALIQFVCSWFYMRRINYQRVSMSWLDTYNEAGDMVHLGLSFMWVGLLSSLVSYLMVLIIARQMNLEAVGLFNAALALSVTFVQFVLGAMGTDFFPRLSGITNDQPAMNRLVNEQTEIALLIALPGLLLGLLLAPWIVELCYSSEFIAATVLLQWLIFAGVLRVIQWPLGYIQLALGRSGWFFFTQTLFASTQVAFIWAGLVLFGLEGAAIGLFVSYVISHGVTVVVSRHLTNFKFSPVCFQLLWVALILVAAMFTLVYVFPSWETVGFGVVLVAVSTFLCIRELIKRIGNDHVLTRLVQKLPGSRFFYG